jgi:hypothetical protein
MIRTIFLFSLCLLFRCAQHNKPIDQDSSLFNQGKETGQVAQQLYEASGLVESFTNPGHLWTINDSGNPAEVFLIDSLAKTKIVCTLKDATNRDWEDIAIGPGPDPAKKYLYVAEIGDNNAVYDYKYIYRFEEPSLKDGEVQIIAKAEKITVVLPDGKRDTETLMIDPSTNDLYIVSKREENVNMYLAKYPFANDTLRPQKVLTLPFNKIVAGSISLDGQEVLLKNYDKIFYWKREGEKTLIELLARKAKEIPYDREPQGEAICWTNDASGFYTLSETPDGKPLAKLRFYKRLK